ncbi:hypothetical protein EP073_12815 [Geovibrio thiophilus]|uniref:Uncharacterized protein n=1 Tax=Geovibrio thiophilus TaxID=139438 RepID=A0A3R6AZQ1_9BACT|nr:hypothetical protein [Geovibrio thiophilus]QAR34254.1 hypothetical protein EP073_12815 [Geovibrio thiophilus]
MPGLLFVPVTSAHEERLNILMPLSFSASRKPPLSLMDVKLSDRNDGHSEEDILIESSVRTARIPSS